MKECPNILFICVDQWPGRLLGCAGYYNIETPTIDRLATSGTRFTRAYSETPVCIPARRSIMTGTSPRVHEDRTFRAAAPMPPELSTLGQTFRDNGYQAYSTGKLHVFPQRDRIGFDDALIYEEGRSNLGTTDDYEIYLAEQGLAGKQNLHGMSQNEFSWAPWHLEDHHHPTNWITLEACRTIKRRDPTKPGFWHVSYNHPHPPLVPLQHYFDRYSRNEIEPAHHGDWANENAPYAIELIQATWDTLPEKKLEDVRRAFYALCTHIDHQIRLIIGTLREENLLDNTVIVFTSDHGEMLGEHNLYAKRLMYEMSANIPMIISGLPKDDRVSQNALDSRLVGLQDVMPTLLDIAGLEVPASCTGISMIGHQRREILYCEAMEGPTATRMVTNDQYKLIWYPAGNRLQLFDIVKDPAETNNLSTYAVHSDLINDLTSKLIMELYGIDEEWVINGKLVGFEAPESIPVQNRNLSGQRGLHYPPIPVSDPSKAHGVTDRWEAKKD